MRLYDYGWFDEVKTQVMFLSSALAEPSQGVIT